MLNLATFLTIYMEVCMIVAASVPQTIEEIPVGQFICWRDPDPEPAWDLDVKGVLNCFGDISHDELRHLSGESYIWVKVQIDPDQREGVTKMYKKNWCSGAGRPMKLIDPRT